VSRVAKALPFCLVLCSNLVLGLVHAQSQVHLLGFVERFCPDEPYCFDLLVKPEFIDMAGEHIRVRFASVQQIYDPENYELTLAQQDIVAGSHLRLLLVEDIARGTSEYQAQFIWIGD